jgi:bifunctional DNA-binding transcriptional regulator/antitoxin component of YhaV-PrlF toxin-antitoxin module
MRSVKVKARRVRGHTRISAKNQVTIPVEALKRAGLKSEDELRVEAAGPGRIVLVRASDVVLRHAGRLTGVYPSGYLPGLRSEWR